MQKKIAFIVNASRKLSPSTAKTIKLLASETDLHVETFKTKAAKDAIILAENASRQGFQYILAVGGDGTCNEVVNGIMLSGNSENVIFGIIPNGTGNDFMKSIEPFTPEGFLTKIKNGNSRKIDLIKVESDQKTKYALNISGLGFDGYVVKTLTKLRHSFRLKGKVAYSLAILRSFISYKKIPLTLQCDEFTHTGKILMLALCNGSTFGHGLVIHPKAEVDSGKLGVTLLAKVSFLDYIRNLGKLKRGEKIIHPEVYYFETKKIEIQSTEKEYFTEGDGELFQGNTKRISLLKGALHLIN